MKRLKNFQHKSHGLVSHDCWSRQTLADRLTINSVVNLQTIASFVLGINNEMYEYIFLKEPRQPANHHSEPVL